MLARDYLNLAQVRLRDGAHWSPPDACLNFIFPTRGVGLLGAGSVGHHEHSGTGRADPSLPSAGAGLRPDVRLRAGDVLVLNGASAGSLRSRSPQAGFALSTFSLCVEHLFPLFAGRDVALLDKVKDTFEAWNHYAADTPVAAECHRLLLDVPPRFDLDHRSQLLRVAAAVLAHEFKDARSRHCGSVPVKGHIGGLVGSLSVPDILHGKVRDLAAKFGCTTRHLNRLFHQHFGCSLASFKMEMRLVKAASLLCDPAAKVVHVATQCGFSYFGQFTARFKRRFGTSPSQWRQAHAGPLTLPAAAPDRVDGCRMHLIGLCPFHKDGKDED